MPTDAHDEQPTPELPAGLATRCPSGARLIADALKEAHSRPSAQALLRVFPDAGQGSISRWRSPGER